MIELLSQNPVGLELRVTGEITSADYRGVLPLAKKRIQERGSFSAVVEITEARRLSAGAIWEDLKFDIAYFRKTKRIAYLGKWSWFLWLTSIPFATHGVRFFEPEFRDQARAWAFELKSPEV